MFYSIFKYIEQANLSDIMKRGRNSAGRNGSVWNGDPR